MIDKQKILAVVPARGGSKSIPRKNLKKLGDKPLMVWAIDSLVGSKYVDKVAVSTEDEEIAGVAKREGVFIIERPEELAGDAVVIKEVIEHSIFYMPGYDVIITFLPTAPFITSTDIDMILERLMETKAKVVSVISEAREQPYHMCQMRDNGLIFDKKVYGNRQFMPQYYHSIGVNARILKKLDENGGIYGYAVPHERGIDIDSLFDFEIAEYLLKRKDDWYFSKAVR